MLLTSSSTFCLTLTSFLFASMKGLNMLKLAHIPVRVLKTTSRYSQPQRRRLSLCRFASGDRESNGGDEPRINPFDFARDDIQQAPIPFDDEVKQPPTPTQGSKSSSVKERKTEKPRNNDDFYVVRRDSLRTGYNTPDENDDEYADGQPPDEENFDFTLPERDNFLSRFLRDTYTDSPYDSRKKRQARNVIRSITFLSFAIGFVFTAVWYLFPGQFISVRADRDFTARYTTSYVDPDNLLQADGDRMRLQQQLENEQQSGASTGSGSSVGRQQQERSEYFDDATGLPEKEQTRFMPETKEQPRAPGRTVDL